MEILLIAVVAAANVVCFVVGAKVGQKVSLGERMEMPKVDPLEVYTKRRETKQTQQQQERIAQILENIDNYDGTPTGQKDVPGGEMKWI